MNCRLAVRREMDRRRVPMRCDKNLLSGEKWERQITTRIQNFYEVIRIPKGMDGTPVTVIGWNASDGCPDLTIYGKSGSYAQKQT